MGKKRDWVALGGIEFLERKSDCVGMRSRKNRKGVPCYMGQMEKKHFWQKKQALLFRGELQTA